MDQHYVDKLYEHIDEAGRDPDMKLDERLLQRMDGLQSEILQEGERMRLLKSLAETLNVWPHDPEPFTNLIFRLIEPESVSFDQICALQPLESFANALTLPSAPINLLILQFLDKAASSLSSVAQIASVPDLVRSWISLWLGTPDSAISNKAAIVLQKALINGDSSGSLDPDRNPLSQRTFRDEGVYSTFFAMCDAKSSNGLSESQRRQRTIAQGRLLDFVINIDGPSSPARYSQSSNVEMAYGLNRGSLFTFTLDSMIVDLDDDLMISVYIESCAKYLEKSSRNRDDWPLQCLKQTRAHRRCSGYYLQPEKDYSSWLVSASATYISAYSEGYPDNFLADKEMSTQVLNVLDDAVRSTQRQAWNSGYTSLNSHLLVLGRLPRLMHLGDTRRGANKESPLLTLPDDVTNENVIKTLIHVFCEAEGTLEKSAARVVYFLYLRRHPNFWSHLVKLAENIAQTNVALASIALIDSFISAAWAPLSPERRAASIQLPTEAELAAQISTDTSATLPASGLEALLVAETSAHILPYLMRPPQRGGPADENSSAWKVASAKFDLIVHIHHALEMDPVSISFFPQLMSELDRRRSMGPMGAANGIGGQVETENR